MTNTATEYLILRNSDAAPGESEGHPLPMSALLDHLDKYTLSPLYGHDSDFKRTIQLNPAYISADMLPFEGHIRYFSTFEELQYGFEIFVKQGSETEKTLDDLIQKNLAKDSYSQALIRFTMHR